MTFCHGESSVGRCRAVARADFKLLESLYRHERIICGYIDKRHPWGNTAVGGGIITSAPSYFLL